MFFEDHIDDAKYCGHLYGLGSGSAYVQNGTGNAYEEEANKQQSWHHSETHPSCRSAQCWGQASAAGWKEWKKTNIYASFSKLSPIGSAHLKQPNMVKNITAVTCCCCVCVRLWLTCLKRRGFSFPKMFCRNVLHFKALTRFYMDSWICFWCLLLFVAFSTFPFYIVNM